MHYALIRVTPEKVDHCIISERYTISQAFAFFQCLCAEKHNTDFAIYS